MLLKSVITSSLLTLALGLAAASAAYGEHPDRAAAPQKLPQAVNEPINPANVSDEHLEKFANVTVKAQEIEDKYEAEVNGAKTMHDFEIVQQKMNDELVMAIEAEGISVEQYEQLGSAVGQDSELRHRAIAKINAKTRPTGD
jgi:hypothetical protein